MRGRAIAQSLRIPTSKMLRPVEDLAVRLRQVEALRIVSMKKRD